MKFSSVVGYHMNPMTCGVAKFNAELAKRLGVPFVGFNDEWGMSPLFSLKWSELTPNDRDEWREAITYVQDLGSEVGVFWHDGGDEAVTNCAEPVFYADPSLGSPGLWCPSLLTPSKPRTVRLFSFGMAHKLQTAHYAKVRQLLEAAGLDYRLRVSVGLHEGTSLDDATKHFDALREIMGHDKVTILGILSDDAVAEELQNAEYVLAFFERGLRANNTTVHAALSFDKHIISNFDELSPPLIGGGYVQNIDDMVFWNAAPKYYSWEHLIKDMEQLCEVSASATA